MSETRELGSPTGFVRRFGWALVMVLAAVFAILVIVIRSAPRVTWSEVMAAAAKQKTINGVGRIYGEDGSEWASTAWIRIDGPETFASNQMLVPVGGRAVEGPKEDVVALCMVSKYPLLLNSTLTRARVAMRVRPANRGGKPALKAEVTFPVKGPIAQFTMDPPYPDRWRFYLDPDTRLVKAAELYREGKLRATVEYRYNLPLPKDFKPWFGSPSQ